MIDVNEEFKRNYINVQQTVNRIYGINMEIVPDLSRLNLDGLSSALWETFPYGIKGMVNCDSLKEMGVKLSGTVNDYVVQTKQPYRPREIDFYPIIIDENGTRIEGYVGNKTLKILDGEDAAN